MQQSDWTQPELNRWSAEVASTVEAANAPCIAVAHSFGVLALAHCLSQRKDLPIVGALLVAPADPEKFGVSTALPQAPFTIPVTLLASENDPWMSLEKARSWAARWGCRFVNLGQAGHVNVASGYESLPLADRWIGAVRRAEARHRREASDDARHWRLAS